MKWLHMDSSHSPVKILVIDDEAIVRDVICTTLEILGYSVISAENGFNGLKLVQTEHPQIVFTDLVLPEMDGQQIISAIRQLDPQAFVVSVSGYFPDDIPSDAALQKPFTQAELKIVLEKAIAHIGSLKSKA